MKRSVRIKLMQERTKQMNIRLSVLGQDKLYQAREELKKLDKKIKFMEEMSKLLESKGE